MHGAAEVVKSLLLQFAPCMTSPANECRQTAQRRHLANCELLVEFICATYIRTLELLFISGQVLSGDPRYLTEGYTSWWCFSS